MRRRGYSATVHCAAPGCGETGLYQYDTRREYDAGADRRRNWKCLRHSQEHKVLSLERPKIVTVTEPSKAVPHGIFWGSQGFIFGEGFMAYCKDFPEGTRLRITAEVILPPTSVELEEQR